MLRQKKPQEQCPEVIEFVPAHKFSLLSFATYYGKTCIVEKLWLSMKEEDSCEDYATVMLLEIYLKLKRYKAIILRIDSPGGDALASDFESRYVSEMILTIIFLQNMEDRLIELETLQKALQEATAYDKLQADLVATKKNLIEIFTSKDVKATLLDSVERNQLNRPLLTLLDENITTAHSANHVSKMKKEMKKMMKTLTLLEKIFGLWINALI
ncbi:hypothetical protein BC332_01786 [Capsicum chinense]|nr:hypothetical protein BC332_01786 [Capsicum chinense]